MSYRELWALPPSTATQIKTPFENTFRISDGIVREYTDNLGTLDEFELNYINAEA